MEGIISINGIKTSVYTDCSSHSTERDSRNKRMGGTKGASEWQRNAIRICGDWSEQLSSKGKIYYYNCMTEVSQWQKPAEWNLPDMDDRELVQRVGPRYNVDGKGLKRHRMFTSTSNVLKTASADDRSGSPKRTKFTNDATSVDQQNSIAPIRAQIMGCRNTMDAVLNSRLYTTVRNLPQNRQDSYRDGTCRVPTKKCVSGSVGSRSAAPYEDMEISPNSSPMSGSSSPINSYSPQHRYHASSASKRYSTSRLQQNINSKGDGTRRIEDASKLGRSSTKLLQLVDAIRDILEQSPNSTAQRLSSVTSPVNGMVYGGLSRTQSRSSINIDGHGMRSPRMRDHQSVRTMSQSSPIDAVSLMSNRVPTNSVSTVLIENDTVDQHSYSAKGVSKLASTLTSLASLISTSRDHTSEVDNSICSHVNSASHLVGSQNPNLPYHPTSQEHASSSVIRTSPTSVSGLNTGFPDNISTEFSSSYKNFHSSSGQPASLIGKLEPFTQPCSNIPHTSSCTVYVNNSHDGVVDSVRGSPAEFNRSMLYSNFDGMIMSKIGGPCLLDRNQVDNLSGSAARTDLRYSLHKSPCVTMCDKIPSSDHTTIPSPSSPNYQKRGSSNRSDYIPESKSLPPTQRSTDPLDTTLIECLSKRRLSLQEKCFHGTQCLEEANRVLDCSQAQTYLDPKACTKYHEDVFERLENEAHCESKRFDHLQSVLYSELSVESKKLRALVRISEAKLAVHKEKQNSLKDLMDTIESRRHLPCSTFGDDAL